jgi:hypothetical protein
MQRPTAVFSTSRCSELFQERDIIHKVSRVATPIGCYRVFLYEISNGQVKLKRGRRVAEARTQSIFMPSKAYVAMNLMAEAMKAARLADVDTMFDPVYLFRSQLVILVVELED